MLIHQLQDPLGMKPFPVFISGRIAAYGYAIAFCLITLVIYVFYSLFNSKRNHDHNTAECASSYCYNNSLSQSCLTPESWKLVPCKKGISNECGGVDGKQSPINFETENGDDCIRLSSNDYNNFADLRTATFEV